jgi:DNA-binding MarR family transcriptional regulator
MTHKGSQERAIDRFCETIPPLWGTIRQHIRAEATGQFDISVEQFHVLRFVRRGTNSISDLATAKNISRPAISQAVDVLVNKGLLTRTQSSEDRRFVELTLTESGNALLDTVFKETRAWMKDLMSGLSTEELDTIANAMESLKKTLNRDK